jgi:hypothetical protein
MWNVTAAICAASAIVVRNGAVFHISRYNAGHEDLQLQRKPTTANITAKFDTASVQKKKVSFETPQTYQADLVITV